MNPSGDPETPFSGLSPEEVLAAVEQTGLAADGRLMALNSYENRVYRVGVEPEGLAGTDDTPARPELSPDAVVVKFYRAARWSDAQILEEHRFALELAAAELAVAAPIPVEGQTLLRRGPFRFAVFRLWRGGAPELDGPGHRAMLGRSLARIHAIGAVNRFSARVSLASWRCGSVARQQVLDRDCIPAPIDNKYAQVSGELVAAVRDRWPAGPSPDWRRIHGDCHPGNILWNPNGPVFVDLDDCLTGPPIQDLWMLVSGSASQQQREWAELLSGYEQFASLDYSDVALIEPLRAMRMLNHAAWIAARWNDPAFPRAFPWFGEQRYWERHVAELQEQLETLDDPPLLRLC